MGRRDDTDFLQFTQSWNEWFVILIITCDRHSIQVDVADTSYHKETSGK